MSKKTIRKRKRTCGACDVCCVHTAVQEIQKPRNCVCPHQPEEGHGCGIYKTRPESCRIYTCFWLEGFGTLKDRPDKSGWILDNTGKVPNTVMARPTGISTDLELPQRASKKLKVPVLVIDHNQFRIISVLGRGVK